MSSAPGVVVVVVVVVVVAVVSTTAAATGAVKLGMSGNMGNVLDRSTLAADGATTPRRTSSPRRGRSSDNNAWRRSTRVRGSALKFKKTFCT